MKGKDGSRKEPGILVERLTANPNIEKHGSQQMEYQAEGVVAPRILSEEAVVPMKRPQSQRTPAVFLKKKPVREMRRSDVRVLQHELEIVEMESAAERGQIGEQSEHAQSEDTDHLTPRHTLKDA